MAIALTHLTTGADTSNTATYTTASVAPGANRLLYLAVLANIGSGTTAAPTITGLGGLTWTLTRQSPSPDAIRTLYWFRATTGASAPTPGALTITFPAALTGACWGLVDINGADLSTGAVQSVEERRQGGTNTNVSFPFTAPITAGNAAVAAVCINLATAITPGTGWTGLGTTGSHSAPTQALQMMGATTPPPTNIEASWTGGANTWVIGVEVPAAATSSNVDRIRVGSTIAGIRVGSSTPSSIYVGTTKVWP